jgi:hypothetical protein
MPSAALAQHAHPRLELYDLDISGNCYKVRLALSLLDVPFAIVL